MSSCRIFSVLVNQYRYIIEYRSPLLTTFGQAFLYKPEKLYPMKTEKKWLSDTPDIVSDTWSICPAGSSGWSYIIVGTKFLTVQDGKIVTPMQALWVYNVHLGLEEEFKTKACYKMIDIVKDLSNNEPYIVTGDFNLFPDRDGSQQRNILTQEWLDLGKDAVTLSGKHVEGTFVGYEHDEFKADLVNMVSRLDHIFSSRQIEKLGNSILYTKTMLKNEPAELMTRLYPSDHLPLIVDIIVPY